jgi:SAM-dependent methyltransferase
MMRPREDRWARLAAHPDPSWYLDPVTARHKREAHLGLARTWLSDLGPVRLLKTDVFEEAYGQDDLLRELLPGARLRVGIDVAYATVSMARARHRDAALSFLVADVCRLPLQSASFDVVFSNSTLDHFRSAEEFKSALSELARVLRPGGRMIITMDNIWNPLYWILRYASRLKWTPFELGYSTSQPGLTKALAGAGLNVVGSRTLIHNPRVISTVIFLALRRALGTRADWPIRALVEIFSRLEGLPTRRFTACFVAACAIKPAAHPAAVRSR